MKAAVLLVLAVPLAFGGNIAFAQVDASDAVALVATLASPLPAAPEPGDGPVATGAPQSVDQTLYKGVVGNLLETVPLDPVTRVDLQRTNAVVSSPLTARSLGLLLGIANPVFLIGGLVWGIWAATQIKSAPEPDADRAALAQAASLTTPLTHLQIAHD